MTKAQVTHIVGVFNALNGNNETIANGYKIKFDDASFYDSMNSHVFVDDDNELAICFRSNANHYTKFKAPFEIGAASFDKVLSIEGIVDMDNFMAAVNAITDNKLTIKQKEILLKWAQEEVSNTNLAPNRARPYYKTEEVNIPAEYHEPKVRDDLEPGDTIYKQGGFNSL